MTAKPTEALVQDWIRSFESHMHANIGDVRTGYKFSRDRLELQKALVEWREVAFPVISQRVRGIFPDGKMPSEEGQDSVFIGWLLLISSFVKTDTGLSIHSPYDYNILGLLCWNGFIRKGSDPLKLEAN